MLPPMQTLCFSLLLLASVIHGEFEDLKKQLKQIIEKGEKIDGLFRPLQYIGEGAYSAVFKGVDSANVSVAMKFSPLEHEDESDREIEMYTYLHAINNTGVEQFGIPAIFYYELWNNYILTVFSFFDGGDLDKISEKGYFSTKESKVINSLIMFRDFVLQSKYLHSCGVRHDDIKVENIMFRKHRSFLIDFNLSRKMNDRSVGCTMQTASKRCHAGVKKYALDDWESFLYTMCFANGVELEWFDQQLFKSMNAQEAFVQHGYMKDDTHKVIDLIYAKTIHSLPLNTVYMEFIKQVYNKKISTPRYDHMYEVINSQIKNVLGPNETPLFTWLSTADRKLAIEDLTKHPLPNIKSIIVPKDFDNFEYPTGNYESFSQSKQKATRRVKI